MKTEIIDMHCHLLPGIDDGSKDMEETMESLHMAYQQGVRKIIMTPHFYPDQQLLPEQVLELTQQVNDVIKKENIDIEVFPGMECMYFSELPSLLEKKEVLTLANSRYVLIEFPPDVSYMRIENGLESIFEIGYIPILAHYHRYSCLQNKEKLEHLRKAGFLLQMNYDVIQRNYGLFRKNPFCQDLKKGFVDFLGSDCHGSSYRKYNLDPSIEWLKKNIPKEEIDNLTFKNPMRILENTVREE